MSSRTGKDHRTTVPHIFAVGDVIGFPALAATGMDQGRLAAYHAFGEPARELQELQPIGMGVHVFGTNATDLVHIGQAIMGCGGTVDYLVDTVLNYPTLSEAYKVAALDVTNKMRALSVFDNGEQ